MKKTGRNDPCPCGSGKKFKKCCEVQMSRTKIKAHVVGPQSGSLIQKTRKLSSIFQSHLDKAPKKPLSEDVNKDSNES